MSEGYYKFRTHIGGGIWVQERAMSNQIQVVDKDLILPRISGEKSVMCEITPGSRYNNRIRSEIGLPKRSLHTEQWYGWSTFFPSWYSKWWEQNGHSKYFMQIHAYPDKDINEKWRYPIFGYRVVDGKYQILTCFDTEKLTTSTHERTNLQKVTLGDVPKNKWEDFVVRIVPYWDNRGQLQVWHNGQKVYEKLNQPVCYNDNKDPGPWFKCGIYVGNRNADDALPLKNYTGHITQTSGPDKYDEVSVDSQEPSSSFSRSSSMSMASVPSSPNMPDISGYSKMKIPAGSMIYLKQ